MSAVSTEQGLKEILRSTFTTVGAVHSLAVQNAMAADQRDLPTHQLAAALNPASTYAIHPCSDARSCS